MQWVQWTKVAHIVFMVTWFAGLFYLPRLFVYHAMAKDKIGQDRFKIMERKLYFGIMTPGAVLTVITGLILLRTHAWELYKHAGWLHIKLSLVMLLIGYHGYCGVVLMRFKRDMNKRGHVFYRWFNEIPLLLLIGITIMIIVRP